MAGDRAPDSVYAQSGRLLAEGPTCLQCGERFALRPRGRNAKFCKPACRAKWHAAERARRLAELEQIVARAAVLVRELRS